jgi:hypothetical protein
MEPAQTPTGEPKFLELDNMEIIESNTNLVITTK